VSLSRSQCGPSSCLPQFRLNLSRVSLSYPFIGCYADGVLQNTDLTAFLKAFEEGAAPATVAVPPSSVLAKDDGIFPAEIWRLVCSLQIAAIVGDVSQLVAAAAQVVLDDLRDNRCAPLSDYRAWTEAIAWALAQPTLANPDALKVPLGREREQIVGEACSRLRKRGYKIEVGAYGPQIDEPSRREIVSSVEALVGLLGGLETTHHVLAHLHNSNRRHDGMWLFGEVGLGIHQPKQPMLPVGWLFSLGLRDLGRPGRARKPAVVWKSLVDLATDFAAAHDCQRYTEFDGYNLHPAQFHRTLLNSALYRELFTLPQMPPKALRRVLDGLTEAITPDDQDELGFAVPVLSREILQLVEHSADDRLSPHDRAAVEKFLPLLHQLTGGAAETVNAAYGDPLTATGRTQDHILLFARGRNRVVTLPRAFLAEAACEFVFELIWSKLPRPRAAIIVGQTLEKAIANACRDKAKTVLPHQEYKVGTTRYELDAATRDADRIVLIETKGKMLTRQSRSGDMFAFFRDYSDSFLRMLSQLARHEIHLQRGLTPLTDAGEKTDDLRPIKVAVSPLSYGPVSDKWLSSSLIRSLVGARLTPVNPDASNRQIIEAFNKRVEAIVNDIALVAPKRDGHPDFIHYLMDVYWLDLGQLLYILERAHTVWDAFAPLSRITFSSRDFWTELRQVDHVGLTAGKWRPVA
jgi:hypothetical protein